MKNSVPYDIKSIVKLIEEQHPEEIDVRNNLLKCTEGNWKSKAYVYFVSPIRPNQPNSDWQHDRCLVVEDVLEGTIVIDVLKNNVVGGVEFVKYIS